MSDLITSILLATGIFITFKQLDRYKADIFNVIVINYLVATSMGFWLTSTSISFKEISTAPWLPISILIGFLFILNFFLIGLSTAKTGITTTTIASKMSMVVPILYSMYFFHEKISSIKIIGITFACTAVVLTIIKNNKLIKFELLKWLLPILLFFGSGITDAIIKYAQHHYVDNNDVINFSFFLFMASAIVAIIISFFRKSSLKSFFFPPVLLGGIILGIVNFGSLYYFIKALNNSGIDSSVIFGITNMSIVSLSVISGLFLYRERISKLNWIGIILSLISIVILLNF